ncbi:helix-turn-helix domain-containing protein [Alkaliphilus hydrothermalis]|uniref:Transcriptional regulator with XRE-family HTH domain n=1 Tax=Alkaliphilus hydrothermalis TaxID=1482730 RepID=A0ABS2NTN2_9FIRM|nr:helix-turn-helix transcriptional regulator [Alkaliphilus hydrothermalis]MBM7616313.1 transcriptional regulator with XRE-family HTH domain [Alkaliphilus hydrothermalis]
MNNACESLGIKIKKYRKNKNLSTAEFANRLNVSAGLINNIENARNDVFNLELLNKITGELEISLNELLDIKAYEIKEMQLDLDKIYINQYSDSLNIDSLQDYSTEIIKAFYYTISQLSCSVENIESISNHLIQELEFIKKYHQQIYKSS